MNNEEMILLTEDEKAKQIALGYGYGKPLRVYNSDKLRYMEDGEIIEFTSPHPTMQNIRFNINNDKSREIWLSQLQGVFIDLHSPNKLFEGEIIFKDGERKGLSDFNNNTFCDAVKGKRFRVEIDTNCFLRIDDKNEKVRGKSYFEVCDYIFMKLDEKDYQSLKGMTKQAACYSLIEV